MRGKICLVVAVSAFAATLPAQAAQYSAFSLANVGNYDPYGYSPVPFFTTLSGGQGVQVASGTAHTDLATVYNFTGTDYNGDPQTASWSVTSIATSVGGVLKSGVSSTLSGGFWNGANAQSLPYVQVDLLGFDASGPIFNVSGVDPSGQPDRIYIQSQASFADQFQVAGAPSLAYVQFSVHVDGTISGRSATVDPGMVLFGESIDPYFGHDGSNSVTLLTHMLPVVGSLVNLSLVLDTAVAHQLTVLSDVSNPVDDSGAVNFLNTTTLVSVKGFDAGGHQVQISGLSDQNGGNFNNLIAPAPVPESSTWVIFLAGFGVVGAAMRSRRKQDAATA